MNEKGDREGGALGLCGTSISIARISGTPPIHPACNKVKVGGVERIVRARTLGQLSSDPSLLQEPEVVVPRLAASGRLTMLAAREKMGKSTLAAFLAAVVSRGGELWNEVVPQGRVLWVGLEEALSDAVRRFDAMSADPVNVLLLDQLQGDGVFEQLQAEVVASMPRLVILDSLAAYAQHVEDENGAAAWTKALQPVVELARSTKAAIVLLHHANKAQGAYRGSTAIGAAMDMIVEMSESSNDPTVRIMKPRGRWRLDAYQVRFDRDSQLWTLAESGPSTMDAREAKEQAVRQAVLDWIAAHPNCGKTAIRSGVGGNAANCDAAIESLLKDRVIQLTEQRKYILAGGHEEGEDVEDRAA